MTGPEVYYLLKYQMKKISLNTLATISGLFSLNTKEHPIINLSLSLSKSIFVFKLEKEKSSHQHLGANLVLSN